MKKATTPTVDAISEIPLVGNTIPRSWYSHPLFKSKRGRVNLPAIVILSEIVFFYRAKVEEDESTGKIKSISKRFKADKLQRTYQSFSDQFGFSKETAADACKFLKEAGLITIEHRTIQTQKGAVLGNVTFLEPLPQAVREVSTYDPPCGVITPPPMGEFVPEAMGEIPPHLWGNLPHTLTHSTTETPTQNTTHSGGVLDVLCEKLSKTYPTSEAGTESEEYRKSAFRRELKRISPIFGGDMVQAATWLLGRVETYSRSAYVATAERRFIPLARNWLARKDYDKSDDSWARPERKMSAPPPANFQDERDQLLRIM